MTFGVVKVKTLKIVVKKNTGICPLTEIVINSRLKKATHPHTFFSPFEMRDGNKPLEPLL